MEVFDYLPLAAIVENKFFCMHGGLSENITTIKDI
jgi:serine/threonine-protein phosphatase 4 catalytic subunit